MRRAEWEWRGKVCKETRRPQMAEGSRAKGWGATMTRTRNVVSVRGRSTESLQHLVSDTIGLL